MHLGGSGFAHIVPTSHGYRINIPRRGKLGGERPPFLIQQRFIFHLLKD
jgi:hypothetical protein